MKNIIIILFVVMFLVIAPSFAQNGWFWQNPYPQGNQINDIFIFDQNTAIAVGDAGTIIKTTDGGIHWDVLNSGTIGDLLSVHFFDTNTGWAVGSIGSGNSRGGITVKTTDGGNSWTESKFGQTIWTNDVYFINANIGWTAGNHGKIFKTTDGGNNWDSQISGTTQELFSVFFTNELVGWVVGGNDFLSTQGVIYKTTDGGINWSAQSSGLAEPLKSVFFINENIGWTVGNMGSIRKTSDGGNNWYPKNSGTTNSLKSVFFIDANIGWIAGGGDVLKTNDGGDNWNVVSSNLSDKLNSISFINENVGWTVGGWNGSIHKTDDGGANWNSQQQNQIEYNLFSGFFINANTGWLVGNRGKTFKTIDGGYNWTMYESGGWSQLNSVHFIDDNIGWTVGAHGKIYKTTNAGINWTEQNSGVNYDLHSVYFVNENNGWAVGGYPQGPQILINTVDGGNLWSSQTSYVVNGLNSIFFIDANNGWAVGGNGAIIHTNDSGENWETQNSGSNEVLNSVFFSDINHGWVVGARGTILSTSDGGNNWIAQTSNESYSLNSVCFINNTTGWISGLKGIVLKTTNGGVNWGKQNSQTSKDLHGIYFKNENTGWAIGQWGTILKTMDSGGCIMPTANFTADQTNGEAPLTVQFTSHSTGDITSWDWNFGDNQTSTDKNPIHTYQQAGFFTVSLTVTGPGGSDTQIRTNYITVTESEKFLTHNTGNLQVSIFDNGNIGHLGISGSGDGVKFKGGADALFSSGIIFGTAARKSVNGHIGSFSINDDLVNVAPISGFETSPPHWNQMAKATFNDAGAPNPFAITIKQTSCSCSGENCMLINYRLFSETTALNDLFVGIFADWDVGGDAFGSNLGGYDTARNMAYQYVSGGTNDANYYAFVALNGLAGARVTSEWVNEGVRDSSFNWISTFLNEPITTPNDYRMWIGSGPFSFSVNDSLDVYFALVAGTNLSNLQANADIIIEKHELITSINSKKDFTGIPEKFSLSQNYPNPFNPSTTISYALPKPEKVTIELYNSLGQKIKTLVDEQKQAGYYSINLFSKNLSSGLYFYRIKAGSFIFTRKMILMR